MTQSRPPSVVHGWKATDLLFMMVKRKNICFTLWSARFSLTHQDRLSDISRDCVLQFLLLKNIKKQQQQNRGLTHKLWMFFFSSRNRSTLVFESIYQIDSNQNINKAETLKLQSYFQLSHLTLIFIFGKQTETKLSSNQKLSGNQSKTPDGNSKIKSMVWNRNIDICRLLPK